MKKDKNSCFDALFGMAIGDALGVPVEFKSRIHLRINPVTDMIGYGTHNQPEGTWSDDTSMAVALIKGLDHDEYSLYNIANEFLNWRYKAYYTPHGKVFDCGIATDKAITKLKNHVSPLSSGGDGEMDNGNGSLMRTIPLAYYLINTENIEQRSKIVHDVSGITHNHIIAKAACHFYVELAMNLISGIEYISAYRSTSEILKKYYHDIFKQGNIRVFDDIFSGAVLKRRKGRIKSGGYVIDSLEASLWCIANTDDFKNAVLLAVNLGDDTDTTGAITGGLAGIIYGYDSFPRNWIEVLANKDLLKECAEVLYRRCKM